MDPFLKKRALAEWRGYAEPTVRPDRLVSVADGIVKLMKSLGLGERLRQEEVLAAWEGIVGEFIATHARPVHLQNGQLIVQVLQPTMHYELDRVWKRTILEKFREQFGPRTVREIRFRIG